MSDYPSNFTGWARTDATAHMECPRCKVPAGMHCHTPSGRFARVPHKERLAALHEKWGYTHWQRVIKTLPSMPVEHPLRRDDVQLLARCPYETPSITMGPDQNASATRMVRAGLLERYPDNKQLVRCTPAGWEIVRLYLRRGWLTRGDLT